MRVRYLLVLVLVIATSLNECFAQQSSRIRFTLDNLEGESKTLESFLRKGPVYISFWALWCEPCKSEMKALQSLQDKFAEQGFTVLAINTDTPKSNAKVKAFVKTQRFTFPVLLDPNSQVFSQLNGKALPYSLLLHRSGKIVKVRTGYLPGDEKDIEQDVVKLLKDTDGQAKN